MIKEKHSLKGGSSAAVGNGAHNFDDSCVVGFNRKMDEPLVASVEPYDRHFFIYTGTESTKWPSDISNFSGFIQEFFKAFREIKKQIRQHIKITGMAGGPANGVATDILVFPEKIRYVSVTSSDIPEIISDMKNNTISKKLKTDTLMGKYVFVCSHQARDNRCGYCGPLLAKQFKEEMEKKNLSDVVKVEEISHVGGHKYAGNVLIFPGGDWYGYVTPRDVENIISDVILGNKIILDKWRGRMGMSEEDMKNEYVALKRLYENLTINTSFQLNEIIKDDWEFPISTTWLAVGAGVLLLVAGAAYFASKESSSPSTR